MALRLRRQAGLFSNGILAHHTSRRSPDTLGMGADSFKRVLGRDHNSKPNRKPFSTASNLTHLPDGMRSYPYLPTFLASRRRTRWLVPRKHWQHPAGETQTEKPGNLSPR